MRLKAGSDWVSRMRRGREFQIRGAEKRCCRGINRNFVWINETCRVIQQQFWMKECDIFRGVKIYTLTHPIPWSTPLVFEKLLWLTVQIYHSFCTIFYLFSSLLYCVFFSFVFVYWCYCVKCTILMIWPCYGTVPSVSPAVCPSSSGTHFQKRSSEKLHFGGEIFLPGTRYRYFHFMTRRLKKKFTWIRWIFESTSEPQGN